MLQPRDLKGRTAISYARWSSERQGAGDSLRRQTEEAERFCDTYGLKLDRQIIDDGVSAFKGANLEADLGRFVAAVRSGEIPSDVVLLVEALDRVSRVNHMDALEYLSGLLKTGVTVVTLMDNRVHTLDDYRNNVASILMSLMAMSAAHEYSAKISERVRASWRGRAEKAKQGSIRISKVPFWIDRETQELNERADTARQIFAWAEEGLGQAAITQRLNALGIPSPSGKPKWGKDAVSTTLSNRAAYGSYTVKGEEIRDYFPPIVTEAQWLALRDRTAARTHNPQASNTANLFSKLLRCAHCGSPLNLTSSKQKGRTFRYLSCSGRAFKRTDCTMPNWNYQEVEDEIISRLGFLAVPLDEGGNSADSGREREIEEAIKVLSSRYENTIAAIVDAEEPAVRQALTKKADEIAGQKQAKESELAGHRQSMARISVSAVADIAADTEEIQRLVREDRAKAKELIGDLIERIELEVDREEDRTGGDEMRFAHVTIRGRKPHTIGFTQG